MSDAQHVALPDGSCLWYVDSSHAYWSCEVTECQGCGGRSTALEGGSDPCEECLGAGDFHRKTTPRLPGVSTIAKALDLDASALIRASARKDHEGIAILLSDVLSLEAGEDVRTALMPLCSADGLAQSLDREELTYRHQWDKAAAEGTSTHDRVLHCLAKGDTPDLDGMSERERGLAEGVIAWWEHRSPQVLNAEQVVMHPEKLWAGRFDLRARIAVTDPDEALHLGVELDRPLIALADLKTSASGFISVGYHAQLIGYEEAAKACGVGGSDLRLVVQVKDDGTWKEHPCLADKIDWHHAHQAYKSATRIKRELDRQWRASRKVAA